jgi:uncharacterized protein YjbI with pentapeptide repeats
VILTGDLGGRNFAGCDLTGAEFRNADLARCDFSCAALTNATMENCFAAEARLAGADCTGLLAVKSNFYRADFHSACLDEALLWKCVLAGADLRHASLLGLTITLDCNSFEGVRLSRGECAELAFLFARAHSPLRQAWLEIAGRDAKRIERALRP